MSQPERPRSLCRGDVNPKAQQVLHANPKAQQVHAKRKRKGTLGLIEGFMKGRAAKDDPVRQAKARLAIQANPLWSARKDTSSVGGPTDLRRAKEPYGWDKTEQSGGQVTQRSRVFLDVYDRHIRDAGLRDAAALLQRAYEIAARVRMTSDRAYTGMPFAGGNPERTGHLDLSRQDRQDLEMLARTVDKLTRVNTEWWVRLKDHILREPDASGRFASVGALGASLTGYKAGTDNAVAAGVMAVIDALIAFEIARQESAIDLHMRDEKKRLALQQALADHARSERERRRQITARPADTTQSLSTP